MKQIDGCLSLLMFSFSSLSHCLFRSEMPTCVCNCIFVKQICCKQAMKEKKCVVGDMPKREKKLQLKSVECKWSRSHVINHLKIYWYCLPFFPSIHIVSYSLPSIFHSVLPLIFSVYLVVMSHLFALLLNNFCTFRFFVHPFLDSSKPFYSKVCSVYSYSAFGSLKTHVVFLMFNWER